MSWSEKDFIGAFTVGDRVGPVMEPDVIGELTEIENGEYTVTLSDGSKRKFYGHTLRMVQKKPESATPPGPGANLTEQEALDTALSALRQIYYGDNPSAGKQESVQIVVNLLEELARYSIYGTAYNDIAVMFKKIHRS